MQYLDLVFADPSRNLACDEALINFCEISASDKEVLRLWEPTNYFIVLGYSNRTSLEVDIDACRTRAIPIFRRFSGGGAVLQGPGCVNYTLVIKNERAGYVGDVAHAYKRVLERHRNIFQALISEAVRIEGISDLTVAGQKFSGNAQHRKRHYTMFHGTFLLNFDLSVMEACLRMPSKQPPYRQSRSHESFLKNLPINPDEVRTSLKKDWQANDELRNFPHEQIEALLRRRYSRAEWNNRY
jgi:lipoate-protein ligase A